MSTGGVAYAVREQQSKWTRVLFVDSRPSLDVLLSETAAIYGLTPDCVAFPKTGTSDLPPTLDYKLSVDFSPLDIRLCPDQAAAEPAEQKDGDEVA
jgi:hypothetical protein